MSFEWWYKSTCMFWIVTEIWNKFFPHQSSGCTPKCNWFWGSSCLFLCKCVCQVNTNFIPLVSFNKLILWKICINLFHFAFVWEMCPWNSLKSPWIFCSKKGTNPVIIIDTSINRHPTQKKYLLRRGFVSTYMKCLHFTEATV